MEFTKPESSNTKFVTKAKEVKAQDRLDKRNQLPSDRFLGSHHPLQFIQDVQLFQAAHKRQPGRRAVPQSEMLELAFYLLRKQVEPDAEIPEWVIRLDGLK